MLLCSRVVQAFEHLLERELISFTDNRRGGLSIEYRPVKLLVSDHELHQGMKSYPSCPVSSLGVALMLCSMVPSVNSTGIKVREGWGVACLYVAH